MTNEVFNPEGATPPKETEGEAPQQQEEPKSSLHAQLVGEGKKFQDDEALARGKLEADDFIEKLQGELAGLREELDRRDKVEDIVGSLRQQQEDQPPAEENTNTTPSLSKDEIASLVRSELVNVEQENTFTNNVDVAGRTLAEKLGGIKEAQQFVATQAKELGVNEKWLMDMAGRSPTAFFKVVGMAGDEEAPTPSPSIETSTVNTEALDVKQFGGPAEGTKEYYDQLRKTDSKKYWSREIQSKIHKLAQEGKYESA